jgi:FkbM family methyltransferase
MRAHRGADLVGRLTRWLPSRRWQATHWLGKLLVPRRPFVGRFRGGLLEVRPEESASASAFFTGFYEREVTAWSLELMRTSPPPLVVDVGANFGYYPLLFGLGCGSQSLAYEPDPENRQWLANNVALNPGVECEVVPAAVGDRDGGVVAFSPARAGRSLWARVREGGAEPRVGEGTAVPLVTLDAELSRRGLAEVPLVLVDVEGFEDRVVAGMSAGIADRRYGAVLVEFHPYAFADSRKAAESIAGVFRAAGYSARRFRPYRPTHPDRDRRFFRLDWEGDMLRPFDALALGEWEHFLFTREH